MKILIVDDTPLKIEKIKLVIEEIVSSENVEILIAENVADAISYFMRGYKIDLLILDLNLPNRKKEEVKKLAGLRIIKEINLRKDFHKPECILGLTAYKTEQIKCRSDFDKDGWAIVHFDLREDNWEYSVRNKVIYLLNKSQTLVTTIKDKILFFASSPTDAGMLNAGMEQRKISEVLQSSTNRDDIELISKTGAKLDTLTSELMKHNPQFVHFTGHGTEEGLAMEEDNGRSVLIPTAALESLFQLFSGITQCVFLSACYSAEQAKSISKHNIYVIGMNSPVGVDASTEFAKGFYQALAEKKDILSAFQFGKVHLMVADPDQVNIPEIWYKSEKVS